MYMYMMHAYHALWHLCHHTCTMKSCPACSEHLPGHHVDSIPPLSESLSPTPLGLATGHRLNEHMHTCVMYCVHMYSKYSFYCVSYLHARRHIHISSKLNQESLRWQLSVPCGAVQLRETALAQFTHVNAAFPLHGRRYPP